MESLKVLITDVKLLYPSIYETRATLSGKDRYTLAFQLSDEWAKWLVEQEVRIKEKDGVWIANAGTMTSPLVTAKGGNYGALIKARDIADARNITLDRVMRGMEADVRVQVFDYNYEGLKGRGIAVVEIIIDADDLLINILQHNGE